MDAKAISILDTPGVDVRFLKFPGFFPFREYMGFGSHRLARYGYAKKEISSLLRLIKPDITVSYHWEALAASYGIASLPKVGLVGDPLNLPYVYRENFEREFGRRSGFLKRIFLKRELSRHVALMKELLQDYTLCGAFACHHAEMFTQQYGVPCGYFHTPLPDPRIDESKSIRARSEHKPKILLLGHLKGIATLSGIDLFTNGILPYLNSALGNDGFQVHIVGDFFDSLPSRLKNKLTSPNIIVRGHVNPIDNEFLTSTMLLVPTPIELGIRLRILTAFSFATPVVAHQANKKGIPELLHNQNALLSDNAEGLAEEIIRLIKDRNLGLTLARNARSTYEKYFSLNSAGMDIVNAAAKLLN